MEAALYGAGFHVVSLASPTYTNFIQTASSTRMPGRTSVDAADLYQVMEKVWEANKAKVEVTDFHVTGYSLGAPTRPSWPNWTRRRSASTSRRS
jgi:hypothetical protein